MPDAAEINESIPLMDSTVVMKQISFEAHPLEIVEQLPTLPVVDLNKYAKVLAINDGYVIEKCDGIVI